MIPGFPASPPLCSTHQLIPIWSGTRRMSSVPRWTRTIGTFVHGDLRDNGSNQKCAKTLESVLREEKNPFSRVPNTDRSVLHSHRLFVPQAAGAVAPPTGQQGTRTAPRGPRRKNQTKRTSALPLSSGQQSSAGIYGRGWSGPAGHTGGVLGSEVSG